MCDGNFRIPKCLWNELFEYQREGVEWMLKLWENENGGILGDEMGLGKTVQIVAFLAALQISGKMDRPSLIVAPSTLLRQWIREFNTWWPPLRVILLHSSSASFNETKNVKGFISGFYKKSHVFITSYGTCVSTNLQNILTSLQWNCVVLDEGHKIRNPDAQITINCKQLKSSRRFVLSGTPIQNNLTELWSLFDFVHPGLLGSLPLFKLELALPINVGGYTNASLFQVQTSYKCACTLRDLIKPFLLRRLKRLVLMNNGNLPEKKEEIVFCRITPYQRKLYEAFISSEDVDAIIERRKNLLAGIDILRKICNHPDLLENVISENYEEDEEEDEGEEFEGYEYDNVNFSNKSKSYKQILPSNLTKSFNNLKKPTNSIERSGKLGVLDKILKLWYSQGHRVLIFCQTRQMLNLIEEYLKDEKEKRGNLNTGNNNNDNTESNNNMFKYMRMDGTTPIKQRLEMVDNFNSKNSPYFIFLLTTRVGGLGINLTGANRVIIFDPDWNPSTDLQARERVYRLGQTRPVSILRLITAGTIEEKIYHRQIFKQFLTQRILEDPKQTRFFKAADLHDLFELTAEEDKSTETADMFDGLEEEIDRKMNKIGQGRRKGKEYDGYLINEGNGNGSNDTSDNNDNDTNDNDNNNVSNSKKPRIDSDPILNDLLDMIGVHSTLPTTGITETIRPEYALIQREAEKIANDALDALEKEKKRNNHNTFNTCNNTTEHFNQFKPNFKGKFGSKMKFGIENSEEKDTKEITAQDILTAINERKIKSSSSSSSQFPDTNLKLALDLVDYFNRVNGKISSDRLAYNFKAHVQGAESAVIFRSILKKIAVFDKNNRIWKLDSNFKK